MQMVTILIFFNSVKNIRKLIPNKRIRLTIDCWDIKVPKTLSFMQITELSLMVEIRKNGLFEFRITKYFSKCNTSIKSTNHTIITHRENKRYL